MHLRLLWRHTLDWCGHLLFHRGWGITGSDGNSRFRGNWKLSEKKRGEGREGDEGRGEEVKSRKEEDEGREGKKRREGENKER